MITVIAEVGINHCGRIADALRLVDVAVEAGADVVKFQIYHTDRLLREVPDRELLRSCELTIDEHARIKLHCDALGIEWLVSCFDREAVELALELGVTEIKVGSGELVNHGLITHIAARGAKLLLSTGMATLDEVFRAVGAFKTARNPGKMGIVFDHHGPVRVPYQNVSLLHCVSNYPTAFEHCNLQAIQTLKRNFFCPVGFSDHTIGFDAAVAAVATGAEIIERHIMLAPGCPDDAVSFSPENFRGYVATIRRAERMMGDGEKRPMPGELEMAQRVRFRWHVPTDSALGREAAQPGEGDQA